jgi:uncharacterized membrane protein
LPDTIPTHFNLKGEVDGYGNKSEILYLPVLATILVTLLSYLSKYPQIFNYPVKITQENASFQHKNAVNMIGTLKFSLVIVFSLITYMSYRNALNGYEKSNIWLLPIIILIVLGPIVYFIYKAIIYK